MPDISTQISRIETARNTMRTKLVELALVESTAKIDQIATAVSGIENRGSVSVNVKEGETYTIPKGYHNGSGTVSGVAGGGNYSLQSKTVTPTKAQQNIVPDEGSYGLSDVTVQAIPEEYQDVTSVTASAADVLANKVIVTADGTVTAGTMTNNGSVKETISVATTSYTIPKGYHDGTGTVSVVTEEKSITPTEEAQVVSATTGKVLSKVNVARIPVRYADVTDVSATAATVLDGESVIIPVKDGGTVTGTQAVTGTMPNNGKVSKTLDTTTTSYTIPAGYHNGQGAVNIVTETKSATPTKAAQEIAASAGKVLSKVTVAAIPDAYQDVTAVTATAAQVLADAVFVDSTGAVVEGTMANNGTLKVTIDGTTTTTYTLKAGYYAGGTVQLDDTIYNALVAI